MTLHGGAPVLEAVTLDQLEDDPYPVYERWRRETPVAYLPVLGGWVVARWDDCETIGKADGKVSAKNEFTAHFFGPGLMSNEPADIHAQMRESLDATLGPKAVRGYIDALARPTAKHYVDQVVERGSADATAEILELISVRAIGDLLGMRDVDDVTLQRWFHGLNLGMANLGGDPELSRQSDEVRAEIDEYVAGAVRRLTSRPDDSSLSHMIHTATPDGRPRTYEQLIATVRMIILGGFQEPGHAAAASLLGLLSEPEQLAATRADPGKLVPLAVHEGLRWISPFGTAARTVLEDIDVGGFTIPAGDEVSLIIASANRDETRYEHPERFDLFRPRVPVASFGYGLWFCAGHFVGRELERVALNEIISRLPGLRLDPDRAPKVAGFDMRGVKALPVIWDA